MVRYLLGEMPEDEQVAIERDYFVSDDAYEQMLIVEDDLAYDYVDGRLSPERRTRFERTIGATERGRKNVVFARALLEALKSSRKVAMIPTHYWMGAIAASILLAALPAWLGLRYALHAEAAASESRLREELAAAVPSLEATFLLTPGLARSGEGPSRLELSPQAGTVRFELVPPPGAEAGDYVVTIYAANRAEVWSSSAAFAGRMWIVQVPAALFAEGTFEIRVRRLTRGEQAPYLATYSFRLARRP